MNGEVSLIVRKATEGPGVIIDQGSGYVTALVSPQAAFVGLQDFTPYIGKYVHIFENYTPTDWGFFKITNAIWDGTYTELFTDAPWNFYPFPTQGSAAFDIHDVSTVSEEYYLDLFENESISQNWQYTDLNNFQALGAFSREFRIPVTDRNQLALGALFDVNYAGGINNYFHYKLPAEIRVDTLPIAKGYVRVRKVYQQQGKLNEVELAFYAETPDLFKTIGEKKLAALTALPSLNEAVTFSNVTNTTLERGWFLVDRGQLWSEEGQSGTRRISDNTTPLYAIDLTPAVRWDYLLQQIFADAGFQLDAPNLLDILAGYYMPWINKSYLDTDDFGPFYAFSAYNQFTITVPPPSGIPNPYQSLTESFDNNNDFNPTTGTYTAPFGGLFTFHVTLNLSSTSYLGTGSRTRFLIFFLINGVEDFYGTYEYQQSTIIDFIVGKNLQAGDTVQLAYRYVITDNLGNPIGSATVSILGSSGALGQTLFELIGTRFNFGSNFIYNLNAPDMRQIDFVNDVIKMHNCAIVPDRLNPNKISIVPYNDYVATGANLDWNSKLDISKDITIYSTVELQKNKTTFTYTAGEDYLSKLYKDNGRIYGDYKAIGYTINPDTTPSTFTTGENTVQLVTRSMPSGNIPGTLLAIPQFINDKNEFVVPGPRCGYSVNSINVSIYDDSAGVESVVQVGIPTLSNYSNAFPSFDDFDLNWAPEVPPFIIQTNPYNNLFNLYWRNYMNEIYSPEARIMEAFFALDLSDILTFEFNDVVYVNNAQWRILDITDYKVGQFESTKVKLIKVFSNAPDCNIVPVGVDRNGVVNFENLQGNPVSPTEKCCVRYGYIFDENTNLCYAFNNQSTPPSNGITGTSTNQIPRNVVVNPNNGNTGRTVSGIGIDVISGNDNTLAVGDTLKLDTAMRGNAMIGKNVLISSSGFHLGGGWKLDDRSQNEGGTQYGIIMFGSKDALAISGDIIQPTIDNTGTHLSIPDDSFWSVMLHLNVTDIAGATTYNGLHMVTFQKVGSIAASTAAILINEDNGFGTVNFAINIDTVTDTTQHRIEIVTTGTGYPYTFFTTLTLTYTAVR